nr:chondroitin sulfate proteoglycan 4-like [Lepeophtheirus salmonis]
MEFFDVGNLVVKVNLPGRFYELNVHFGVFVGGMGTFNEIFLGNQENFRGCLENLFFNGVDILNKAHESAEVDASSAIVHGITWNCSPEFDGRTNEPLSFMDSDSFISFPNWIGRTGAMIMLKVKTISKNAVLFYNTGSITNKDFVALEIWDGVPRLLLNQGNGPIELSSGVRISDGKWHEVLAQFSPKYLELSVDGQRKYERPSLKSNSNKHIDLSGHLYFGGMDSRIRKRAIEEHGIDSSTESPLNGCISDIQLDGRLIGLPDVVETLNIRPGCLWTFPCFESNPCSKGKVCRQKDLADYICVKKAENKDGGYNKNTHHLQVQEGNRAVISIINLDTSSFINYVEHEIAFRITKEPTHGKIKVWNRPSSMDQGTFTLIDVQNDKVYYEHDGTEITQDACTLSILARGNQIDTYTLLMNISPSNDPPQLEINPDAILRIPRGSKSPLDPSFFNVVDLDNRDKDIIFSMLPPDESYIQIINDGSQSNSNEESNNSGGSSSSFKKSMRFSLDALRRNSVYLCPSVSNTDSIRRIGFRISDGESNGNIAYLKVSSFDLIIYAVNNTGLTIPTGTSALISSYNLTFTSNVPEQGLNIRFDIVQEPKYGRLERLKNNGRWVSTKRFFSRHLEKGKLRYVHTRGGMGPGRPSRDSFTFSTAIGQDLDAADSKEKSIHVFKIEFISLQVRVIRNIPVKLLNVRETVLTDTHLLFQTYPETSEDSDLIYTIIDLPKYGTLLSNNDKNILKPGSNFTQVELLSGHLKYRLNNRAFKEVNDSFTFDVRHVSVEGSRSDIQVFEIYHVPGDSEVEITLERLEVEEGGKKTITQKYLNIVASDIRHFVFNITKAPRHGQLDVLSANKLDVLRSNATFFTSEEIKDDRIVYKHDDSESRRDTFHFLVMSSSRSRHDFQYLAVFHIHIVLRNDQTPTRVVDKVFQVVDGGSKLLTERDLLFVDHDIDSRPQDIKYTHTAIPNGNLVSVDNPSKPVFQFSQKDLHDRKIMFKHLGAPFGRIMLWVSDGLFFVSTELKVRASPPFVKVLNNTGLVVQERDAAFISSANLSVETNLNAFGPSIRFRITSPPSHGNLLKDDVMVSVFTEDDIVKRRVEYRNSPGTAYKDFFKFIVEVGNDEDREPFINEKEGTFEFHIYPESYWDPLEISSNKSLLVEESTSIAITRKDLRVSQGDLPSSDIIYKVITHPKYGYLELDPIYEEHMDSNVKVNSFTQQLIDEGHLHYIQSVSNQSDDSFRFEVTNGISTLRDLLFHFTIVPTNLYIETRNLVVTEGSKIPISPENLHVLTSYYEDKIKDYLIVDPPKRGRLESLDARKDLVTLFFSGRPSKEKYLVYSRWK